MSTHMKIAFLGLGAMGSRMASRSIDAGFDTTVWNRSPERTRPLADRGARVAGTPKNAAQGADIVIAMVRDDVASSRIWLDPETGALAGMARGAVAIESSTLGVDHVRRLATAAEAAGIDFLDAPVAGSRPQAEAGQLVFIVGGERATLELARSVLDAMGSAVHHAGASGAGAAVKLAVNALFGIQVAALAELTGRIEANGVELAWAVEIIGATPVMSRAAGGAAASMLAGTFEPMFPVELVEKDFGYVAAAGKADMPMVRAAHDVLRAAISAGYGDDNLAGIVRLYRKRASDLASQ